MCEREEERKHRLTQWHWNRGCNRDLELEADNQGPRCQCSISKEKNPAHCVRSKTLVNHRCMYARCNHFSHSLSHPSFIHSLSRRRQEEQPGGLVKDPSAHLQPEPLWWCHFGASIFPQERTGEFYIPGPYVCQILHLRIDCWLCRRWQVDASITHKSLHVICGIVLRGWL